jgi:signal transduction histidine kinase
MAATQHDPVAGVSRVAARSARRGEAPAPAWPLVERRLGLGVPHAGFERRASAALLGPIITEPRVPPLAPFRWAAIAVGVVVGASRFSATSYRLWIVTFGLVAYAAYRTFRPIGHDPSRQASLEVVAEMSIHTLAVVATGSWWSPFAFSLLPSALLAGFARGPRFAVRLTSVAALAVSVRHVVVAATLSQGLKDAGVWLGLLMLVAISSGWARQVSHETARQQSLTLDRLGQLTEANALLSSLHRVAQTLPASLDLDDVLSSTLSRLRDLIDFTSCAILLYEDSDQSWTTARRSGPWVPGHLATGELPPPLLRALSQQGSVLETDLAPGTALCPESRSGLYAALYARGARIGVVAIESDQPHHFDRIQVELLNGLAAPFGVAIDNARIFARLRSIGADEERSRIARDLHDRIGQSLAHLGFELDRAVRSAERGGDLSPLLEELRADVRATVTQVRETLYDLRTDVSEHQDVGATMALFVERVRVRSGIAVELDRSDAGKRLPLLQEREMWRIAKEAVVNVERHAQARALRITWRCDGRSAELRVADDGKGFSPGSARPDSYGILGMKERATSIGASFDIESAAGAGTTVRVALGAQRLADRRAS